MPFRLLFLLFLLLLSMPALVSGCATPAHPPNVSLPGAHNGGAAVAFGPPGSQMLASSGLGGRVRLWHAGNGREIAGWHAHPGPVWALGFIDDGKRLLTGGEDGKFIIWELDGTQVESFDAGGRILGAVVDDTHATVVASFSDGKVRSWQLPDMQPTGEWQVHDGAIRAVAWHAGSNRIASSGHDGEVYAWPRDGTPHKLANPPTDASSLAFSVDGQDLYGGGWFKLFRWSLADATLTVLPTEHQGALISMQFTPDGSQLATISRHTDSAVYLLNPDTGVVEDRFWRHDLCGMAVRVSPDGRYMASTSDDSSVRIWDMDHLNKPEIYRINLENEDE